MAKKFWTCYEGDEGDAAVAEAAAAEAAAAEAAAAESGTDLKVTSQDELNSVLAREKKKFRAEREKTMKQLTELTKTVKLSTQQKVDLETQIDELKTANMTAEERARHQATKLEKDFTTRMSESTKLAKEAEDRFQNLKIGYDINSASVEAEVLPNSVVMVEALLRPNTRLVQDTTESGEILDSFTAKVKFADVDKDNKPITLDLTVNEAVKRMKELPERFGNLFKGTNAGGLGGNTGTPGKKPNVANLSTEEYLAARKKDKASVGL